MSSYIADRAVVLGAGMAGLLATRVLADHFAEVVVIERDSLPDEPVDRAGTAQGRHAHALLAGGQKILEDLFPGFTRDIAASGAPIGDVLDDTRMYVSGHRLHPAPSGLTVISASRALLEYHVRARVRARPNVRFVERCDVTGLVLDQTNDDAIGIRLLRRGDHSAAETLDSNFTLDTTGRGSRAPAWLDAAGYASPDEERVTIDVAYATRRYRLDREALDGDLAIINGPTPANPRCGVLALLENNQGMLTLAGMLGDRPPLDPEEFSAFSESLEFPDINDAIVDAEALDDPVPHRFPASRWRRYDRLQRSPNGFGVLGDAVCSLNPIYGQGMTVAALEAIELQRHLQRHRTIRPRHLHREMAKVLRAPWQMVCGADLQFPNAQGRRTRSQSILANYVSRLHDRASSDARLGRAFVRVSGLVDPPQALLRPSIAARVLRPRHRP